MKVFNESDDIYIYQSHWIVWNIGVLMSESNRLRVNHIKIMVCSSGTFLFWQIMIEF